MAGPRAKGVNFRTFLKVLRRLRGERIVEATLDDTIPELARNYRSGLVFSGNWYPIAWYADLHRAARKATGAGLELAQAIGFESVKDDLSGIYRIFLLVVSPEFVLSKAPLLFNTYYDTGTMEVYESGRGHARARFSGCTGFDANLWADVTGSCRAALEAAGAREVTATIRAGGGDGDDHLDLEARWR
jgi:hypothetical protein